MSLLRSPQAAPRWIDGLVLLAAAAIAVASARPYAGSWNDGSRLATAESLVDEHTLAIDGSVFVQGSQSSPAGVVSPYPPDAVGLRDRGTLDKILVGGHYSSDKPPVHAVLMAAVYQAWRWCGGWPARRRPAAFRPR